MNHSRIFTTLSISLLFSCPHIYSNSTALSLSDIEQVIDINNNSYVYVTPEVIQNIKQLKAFIKPESWPQTLTQLTQALDSQKLFITRQTAQSALEEALAIVNHPDMPITEKQTIKQCLENYAQDIESGKALVSIEQEDTPQYRKSCTTPTRIGIFCDLLVKQNLNVRGTVKINNLNGILQATDGIISSGPLPEPADFSGTLEGDVTGTQKNTVVSSVCGVSACDLVNSVNNVVTIVNSGTPLNEPDTLVLRNNTGSFAAQNMSAEGTLAVTSNATIGGNAAITGSTTIGANIGVIGNAAVAGNTAIGGNATVGLNAAIGNDVTIGGNINLNPSTTTDGNILKGADLFIHNIGGSNTAVGIQALNVNSAGLNNVAIGSQALLLCNNGINTAVGANALSNVTFGLGNTALGIGAGSNHTGGDSNNIDIGNNGQAGQANVIRIGDTTHTATFLAGIPSNITAPGDAVLRTLQVNTNTGQLFFIP